MPTLVLMRHAKSSYPPGVDDAQRPLSERGEADADAAGRWLQAAFPVFDEAIVSPARRARETWHLVGAHLDVDRVREDLRIYEDWGSRLRDVVADVTTQATTVLLMGHNPGVEEFALALAGDTGELARSRMSAKFPTSGIAVVRWEGDWSACRRSELLAFAVPRG